MSLHVPAGACIPVASGSQSNSVPPIEPVLKHCGVHKHNYYNIHARDPKQSCPPAGV